MSDRPKVTSDERIPVATQEVSPSVVGREIVFVSSRYNFSVPTPGGVLLYNSRTGAVLRLSGPDSQELANALCRGVFEVEATALPLTLTEALQKGGFLVPSGTNELLAIRESYWAARKDTPIVLTLTTTMDCNLGCYYCYESRTKDHLMPGDVGAICSWATERLKASPKPGLHVDWYGGEPLLNLDFIEAASVALQRLCASFESPYSASVISNGTAWPADCGQFVKRHQIRQVQVSFDGLKENHDRRRHYRAAAMPSTGASSFERAVALVDQLLDHCRVDIRLNMDRHNQGDLRPFVDFARSRGWFGRRFPAVIQPARLAAFSAKSSFMRKTEMELVEFDRLRDELRSSADVDIEVEESEVPDGFPYPKTSVCAALANRSVVVGADGLTYRCGLQVGEKDRAVGRLIPPKGPSSFRFPDADWWNAFDPTVLPNCARCSFLPVCWGGCPKRHLEGDTHALTEQSTYWRTNLPRLITSSFDLKPPPGFAYSEADQFR